MITTDLYLLYPGFRPDYILFRVNSREYLGSLLVLDRSQEVKNSRGLPTFRLAEAGGISGSFLFEKPRGDRSQP
jgi:hypothetical protein